MAGKRLAGFRIDPRMGLRLSYEHERISHQHLNAIWARDVLFFSEIGLTQHNKRDI